MFNFIRKVQSYLAFKSKVKEADALFRKDGERRFIVPFNDGSLEILTKEEALTLKKQGLLPKDFTARTIYNACFYFTGTTDPTAASKSQMPQREVKRRRQYFYVWFQRHHK